MTLLHILLLAAMSFLAGSLNPRWRRPALLVGSLLAIYWLQPPTPIRNLDFWFPTASILLVALVWAITQEKREPRIQRTFTQVIPLVGVILVVGLTRYLEPLCCLTPTRPPVMTQVIVASLLIALMVTLAFLAPKLRNLTVVALLLLLAIFIFLKTDVLGLMLSAGLRYIQGQDARLASALDLRWLGFSYLAFRLLHVLRDFQLGKTHNASLGEFTTYALFFPALTAGPIDRSQRFIEDLREENRLTPTTFLEGGWRILYGIFKKFVLADSLAIFALNPQNAVQMRAGFWAWVLLYTYTLRIYFDFAGYTDIAVGLGRWLGVKLPENFASPYFKTNLTAFWNSWHITLAQWFRAYFFNPVTRWLRSSSKRLPVWLIILAGQAGTMLLIGLWHGMTWNFAAWGLWHAAGLFAHNRWSEWVRPRLVSLEMPLQVQRIVSLAGWLLTFHYVVLGWVWFAMPDISLSISVFHKLFRF